MPESRAKPTPANHDAMDGDAGESKVVWSFGEVATFGPPRLQPNPWTPPRSAEAVIMARSRDLGLTQAFQGSNGERRAQSVRSRLDVALDLWWSAAVLPAPALLRDGLLVLEAGHALDETQRSLLLRAALAYRKGIITALRHQTEPERTAFLVKEALLDERAPLPPAELLRMIQEDDHALAWGEPLAGELRLAVAVGREPRSTLAATALAQMESSQPLPAAAIPLAPAAGAGPSDRLPSSRRWLIGLLLAATLIGGLAWQQQRLRAAQGTWVPAGTYILGDATDGAGVRGAQVEAFAMDRTEVTNRDYGRCVTAKACPAPASYDSATHRAYFVDPSFDSHPVVNVTWEAAAAFCQWSGKRLPTGDEWEIAAALAPATGMHFRYPWGDVFETQLANSVLTGAGDTQAAALYHPAGDSQLGVSDLAGNAAEWTATLADDGESAIVKGGSYRDGPELLNTAEVRALPRSTAAPWLGFRCVTPMPGH